MLLLKYNKVTGEGFLRVDKHKKISQKSVCLSTSLVGHNKNEKLKFLAQKLQSKV